MKFLIQYNLMSTDQLNHVHNAVQKFPHQYVGLIPFSRELTSDQPVEGVDYIPYGSTLLSTLGLEYKWKGLFLDLDQFNYRAAVKNRTDMLNDHLILPVDEAIEFFRGEYSLRPWFVRPSHDLKQFSGMMIGAGECADWLDDAMQCDSSGTYKIESGTDIVIAPLQHIEAEWRWFIVDGKIVDGSMYRAHGHLIKQHETDWLVIKEAQSFADDWLPAPCVVMDTALVDGELKVIEFNTINSSGFYGHDVDVIFSSLYDYCNE